ncbi:MAG TPA: patatin family protein, partial [Candidatus Aphodousia faecigallinarum]|nr:patatin family protein [Candidatus Aphodousia faecigallinarum]
VTCTNVETGKPEYLQLTDMDKEIDGLRASASLPYVSQMVEFRGMKLLDGGCSDRIPLRAFERLGFDRNIVISTQPREHKVKDRDAYLAKLFYRKYPRFCETFACSPEQYEQTQRYIDLAVENQTAFIIRPQVSLSIGRLTHDPNDVQKGYEAGQREASALIPVLKDWIKNTL